MKYVFLVPFYWLAVSVAGVKALYQLIFKPHFWEKTVHGLHLAVEEEIAEVEAQAIKAQPVYLGSPMIGKVRGLVASGRAAGGVLIIASVIGNLFNFTYNAYLGRVVSIEEFGLVSLVGSFLFIVTIPFNSLSRTITHKSAHYLGEYETALVAFWQEVRKKAVLIGLIATLVWLALTPIFAPIFKSPSVLPFALFAPVWFVGIVSAVDIGFLYGNMKFVIYAGLMVTAAISKFIISWLLVSLGFEQFVYAAVPGSIAITAVFAWLFASSIKGRSVNLNRQKSVKFPFHFFVTSAFSEFSILAFLSFDVILAKVFLSPTEAGQYAILALFGKMIFFVGGLFGQFITPIISREEGAKRDSKKAFYKLFLASAISSTLAYLVVGLFGFETGEILIGSKVQPVEYLLPLYGFGILAFTVAARIVNFYQVRHKHIFPTVSFLLALSQIVGISLHHGGLLEIVQVMSIVGILNLVFVLLLHFFYDSLKTMFHNLTDLFGLFAPIPAGVPVAGEGLKVLVFNWRDIKHVWGGGSEVYIHEISKRLVDDGNSVTLFCGNDRHNLTNEAIDGVNIVRRGGFYTVYLWAFLYYIFKFRNKFDVIVDSENGIPFFTPIYAKVPVVGLVHHVHQEVFRRHLFYPFAKFAQFLEGNLMPFVYKNVQMVTVSNSSKEAMEAIGFGKRRPIEVINPGVDLSRFKRMKKSKDPSVLYLGRLKPYKSVDVLIRAIKAIAQDIPDVTLTIAGGGESRPHLEQMVKDLNLSGVVKFVGKISEKTKAELLARSWVFAQPSMIEGWGITIIEANASGTPVVASNVPGLRDSVKNPHNGFLVPWGNASKFAEKITLLINDEDLRKDFGDFGLVWARNFRWEKNAGKFKDLIHRQVA